jgi:hypothetical protein
MAVMKTILTSAQSDSPPIAAVHCANLQIHLFPYSGSLQCTLVVLKKCA